MTARGRAALGGLVAVLGLAVPGPASGQEAEAGADTVAARRSFQGLAEEVRPGTPAHRMAARRLFSLRASEPGGARQAEEIYVEFVRLYPEPGSEARTMAAELALAYARQGREADARRILDGADPRAGTGGGPWPELEGARALLALWAGLPEVARARLRDAVGRPGGTPSERTARIALLAALETADSTEAATVGRALGELSRDPSAVTADGLLGRLSEVPAGPGHPALLALAAEALQGAGRPGEATAVRRHLVDRHPEAPEAPVAMLELGRALRVDHPAESRAWLERLLVEYPGSAVGPLARRLLAEMTGAPPGPP